MIINITIIVGARVMKVGKNWWDGGGISEELPAIEALPKERESWRALALQYLLNDQEWEALHAKRKAGLDPGAAFLALESRLDTILWRAGLFTKITEARACIRSGYCLVEGVVCQKPETLLFAGANIELSGILSVPAYLGKISRSVGGGSPRLRWRIELDSIALLVLGFPSKSEWRSSVCA
jgi:hypothetical protein